jgi:hypothetical protein
MLYTKHAVIKSKVSKFNIFIYEMPVAGIHIKVYNLLKDAFLQEGEVFSGSVNEFVQLDVNAGLNERALREGFKALERYGFLIIRGDVFTPTDQFVNRFS